MLAFLAGKKTYLLAAAVTAYALFGWWRGLIPQDEAMRLIMESGFGATIRNAIATDTKAVTAEAADVAAVKVVADADIAAVVKQER